MKADWNAGKSAADMLIKKLKGAGFEAWYVGGCVRDFCMRKLGREIPDGDIDLTSSATPEEMEDALQEFTIIETGIRHGTVTVLVPVETAAADSGKNAPQIRRRIPVEITTFRSDGTYSDSRHPDQVRFVRSLGEDLARRDFTINAMAMDDKGNIADPFGGRADLEAGIIRAVGDPGRRFQEDALRIMRALRFAAVLPGVPVIEPATEGAIFRNKDLLKNISAERILVELRKLVAGDNAGPVIRRYVDVLGVVMPELLEIKGFEQHNPYHKYDVLEHCIRAMEAVRLEGPDGAPRDYMKIAALLHDIGKPETFFLDEEGIGHMNGHPAAGEAKARAMLRRLKADNDLTGRVCSLIKYHDLVFQQDEKLLKRWMNKFGPELLLEILEIKRADNFATGNMSVELANKFDAVEALIEKILAEKACFSLKDLEVNGRDLMDAGITEGREIGRILDAALEAVIGGRLPNKKSELLEFARSLR